jgi:hypothetical protein
MKIIIFAIILGASVALISCSPQTMDSKSITPESKPVETETITPFPSKTPTATPAPLEGKLFFDMNGSGLRDKATFNFDSRRLTDERQPLQPDLLRAVKTFVEAHPKIKDGDLITIDEPALSEYSVCAEDKCTTTDSEGVFTIPGITKSSYLKITDPNKGTPALEMRYINQWKGPVTVPEYTKDVGAKTMAKLTKIPTCSTDANALACKLDKDTLQVREQHLNDTQITTLDGIGVFANKGEINQIGLMQGFLTLPFDIMQYPKPFILGGFDILGQRCFKSDTTFESTRDGEMLNYQGLYANYPGDHATIVPGVDDSHVGLDYYIPEGVLIVLASPSARVVIETESPDPELRLNTNFVEYGSNAQYMDAYGHFDVYLVNVDDVVYRGQIIGLGGTSGIGSRVPELHFDLSELESNAWCYRDQYRYVLALDPLPTNFWGNPISLWSSDNNPVFSSLGQP